ncbi:MAG: AAA family ATPase, partial [Elusimicrobiota bacterium]
INSIQLKNFKCFEDRTFAFGSRVNISGKNGSGKTTLREAILFVLYNRTETTARETDKYIRNGEDFCEVTLNTNQGIIKRQRGRSSSKLWLNEKETTQENLVDKLKLPEFAVFNSVFTAGYFMCLDQKTQRQIVLDLTDSIDQITIFKKNGGTEDDIKEYALDIENVDECYKKINSEKQHVRNSVEEEENKLSYMINALEEKCEICGSKIKDKKKLENKIDECKELISQMKEKQVEVKNLLDIIKKIPRDEIEMKMKTLETDIKKIIPSAEIKLMELLKSKIGYRPVFKLMISGKEYKFLSTGEKKRVDVGLCEFLNKFYKLDIIFADNMESISSELPINFDQIFTSQVDSDDMRVVIK